MRYIPKAIVNLYDISPIWTRSLASTMYGVLKRSRERNELFHSLRNELEVSQWWSREQLDALQCERLISLISYSAKHVPYYRRVFARHGIKASHIQTPEDLNRLPKLTKDIVRQEKRNLISDEYDVASLRTESTSGTTGSPLTIWLDDRTYLYARAVQELQYKWAGRKVDDWIGVLAGYKVIPIAREKPPFWVKNYAGKQIHFSSYHLNAKNVDRYLGELRKSSVRFLLGYPSTVGLLAKLINEHAREPIPLKGVFASSEPVYGWHREEIDKAFQCRIYDFYGQAERIGNAINCDLTTDLHATMETSIVELDEVVDGQFTITGTSLVNYAMPLIRYEMNDVTAGFVQGECSCGRKHRLIKPIQTKMEDYVVTPRGNIVSASILTFPLKTPEGIIESQIVQEEVDVLRIMLVTDSSFDRDQKAKLQSSIMSCVGSDMHIIVEEVDRIPRTQNGKFRFLISHVEKESLNTGKDKAITGEHEDGR